MNRRIDDLVMTLLTIEEDMFHDRMKKEVMNDSYDASLKHGNEVLAADGKSSYTVCVHIEQCSLGCVPHCTSPECSRLCRCMMECTCTDYRHGHICKHAHKVLQICYTFCALLLNGSKVIVSILGASTQSERKRGQPLRQVRHIYQAATVECGCSQLAFT